MAGSTEGMNRRAAADAADDDAIIRPLSELDAADDTEDEIDDTEEFEDDDEDIDEDDEDTTEGEP